MTHFVLADQELDVINYDTRLHRSGFGVQVKYCMRGGGDKDKD